MFLAKDLFLIGWEMIEEKKSNFFFQLAFEKLESYMYLNQKQTQQNFNQTAWNPNRFWKRADKVIFVV